MQMNEKNVILWKITDFSWQNMCFLYFVASNWERQSLEPKLTLSILLALDKTHTSTALFSFKRRIQGEFTQNSQRLQAPNDSN